MAFWSSHQSFMPNHHSSFASFYVFFFAFASWTRTLAQPAHLRMERLGGGDDCVAKGPTEVDDGVPPSSLSNDILIYHPAYSSVLWVFFKKKVLEIHFSPSPDSW